MTNETFTTLEAADLTPKPRHKTQRTKTQWKAILDELSISELTQAAFCKKHKIATSSLHKWHKYFSNQPSSEFIDISEPLATAKPQQTPPEVVRRWQVELELGSGVVLRVSAR